MNGRTILSNALKTALPTWQIVSDATTLDSVKRQGACVLWTNKRIGPELLTMTTMQDEITLWIVSDVDPIKLEDDLDAKLLQVLEVLENQPELGWSEAERGLLEETWPGWRITVYCAYTLEGE